MKHQFILLNNLNILLSKLPEINNINCLHDEYKSSYNIYTNNLFSDKIKVEEKRLSNNIFMFRIIKVRCLCDNPIEESYKYIGCLDYQINKDKDNIKIEYLSVTDKEYTKHTPDAKEYYLEEQDALKLNQGLLKYVENIALANNISKIIVDVHGNLRIYDKFYLDEGFKITDRYCLDNPYWIEVEKSIAV